MKKTFPPIPYEVFLSELYIVLRDYHHPEKKKSPVFRVYSENVEYIIEYIESASNKKITIDKDTSRLKNYSIDPDSSQYILFKPLVCEELYPPYFHPNWRKYIKDGIIEYLFNSPMHGIVEYFNKADIKFIKESVEENFIEPKENAIEEPAVCNDKSFFKKIFWWLND